MRFSNAQAAWSRGRFGLWPRFKTPFSMGHYRREDIPFQFALAEAFTVCDAYHCSITSGTSAESHRVVVRFECGSGAARATASTRPRPARRGGQSALLGEGRVARSGLHYSGAPFSWQTIPELLDSAGVSWRIYQDPNDNGAGTHARLPRVQELPHGEPRFASVLGWHDVLVARRSHVARHDRRVASGVVDPAAVSRVGASEAFEPDRRGCVHRACAGRADVQSEVWKGTAFFLTFDENDGYFDHVPPPAPPSYDLDGRAAGRSTVDLSGEYFHDPGRNRLDAQDTISGTLRPWGLGARVPMYVISPWSRGGWVNSEVFDAPRSGVSWRSASASPFLHRSWRRAVCGDLSSAFDFTAPIDASFPSLPKCVRCVSRCAGECAACRRLIRRSRLSRCFRSRARVVRARCLMGCRRCASLGAGEDFARLPQ